MSQTTITTTPSTTLVQVGELKYYGSFYSTLDQTNAGDTSQNKITYNNTDFSNGISIVDNTKITIANHGFYNIEFSAQFAKTDAGDDIVNLWICKNGNPIDNSNTEITLMGNNGRIVASWNWFVQAAAGDYFELCWWSGDTNVRLDYVTTQSNPTRPAIPSVILTVHKVG